MLIDFLETFHDFLDPDMLAYQVESFKKNVQDCIFNFSAAIEVLDNLMEDTLVVSGKRLGLEGRIRESRTAALAEAEVKKEARDKEVSEASS